MSLSAIQQRSLNVFPAGSNGEFNLPDQMAVVISHGEGSKLWDAEGKEYLDFSMGWGSVLVGHARTEVVEAVRSQAADGSNFAYVNEQSLALGEELVRVSPACDAVRFCASGTEATMYCMRLARAHTGRSKILKFEGAYHGANDIGTISLFPQQSPPFPTAVPSSDGIWPEIEEYVLVAPFNDLETTRRIVIQHASDLAGIIVEPFHRCLAPIAGFLPGLRQLADDVGAALIFDEVVTGFRFAYGGAQEYYGVVPELVAYGKALGGGYPIGAFGGCAEIMHHVREDGMHAPGYVWVASTLGGNPVSCAAGRAALGVLRGQGVYEQLHRQGAYLRQGMVEVIAETGVAAQVLGDGPLAQVVFCDTPVTDYRSGRKADSLMGREVMLELFRAQVFLNPMGTKLYLSLAHTDHDCDEFLRRFRVALGRVVSA